MNATQAKFKQQFNEQMLAAARREFEAEGRPSKKKKKEEKAPPVEGAAAESKQEAIASRHGDVRTLGALSLALDAGTPVHVLQESRQPDRTDALEAEYGITLKGRFTPLAESQTPVAKNHALTDAIDLTRAHALVAQRLDRADGADLDLAHATVAAILNGTVSREREDPAVRLQAAHRLLAERVR